MFINKKIKRVRTLLLTRDFKNARYKEEEGIARKE